MQDNTVQPLWTAPLDDAPPWVGGSGAPAHTLTFVRSEGRETSFVQCLTQWVLLRVVDE